MELSISSENSPKSKELMIIGNRERIIGYLCDKEEER